MNRTSDHPWVKEFPGAITVCDSAGTIIELNDRAMEEFRDQGGEELIGTNVLECHPDRLAPNSKSSWISNKQTSTRQRRMASRN